MDRRLANPVPGFQASGQEELNYAWKSYRDRSPSRQARQGRSLAPGFAGTVRPDPGGEGLPQLRSARLGRRPRACWSSTRTGPPRRIWTTTLPRPTSTPSAAWLANCWPNHPTSRFGARRRLEGSLPVWGHPVDAAWLTLWGPVAIEHAKFVFMALFESRGARTESCPQGS